MGIVVNFNPFSRVVNTYVSDLESLIAEKRIVDYAVEVNPRKGQIDVFILPTVAPEVINITPLVFKTI